ncbi:MAG TPA: HEAT repeat domain-containing protein [Pseudolabrys sp.]|nr:HEAT repeat domain-containing protein [Pseudolabrys sp.]
MRHSGALTYLNTMPGGVMGNATGAGVLVVDTSTFLSVNSNSSTGTMVITQSANQAVASPAYTFSTTVDQYKRIFSAQCDRVSNYIFGQLEYVSRSDDEQNESISEGIANVISLVGEPAAYTAFVEAKMLKDNPGMLGPLFIGIATADHKETEQDRVEALRRYAGDENYRVRRAAIRALGRMEAPAAQQALKDISRQNQGAELGQYAAALLR